MPRSATATVPEITDDTFAEEVLASPVPVLVDFTADWCPPCRMIAPVLAAVAAEREGELRVVSLDVDHNPDTTAAYGVMSMPTLMLFRAGEPLLSLVGARSRQRLLGELDEALARHGADGDTSPAS
jgi:thioredoxin 1